jgi:methionyl-tRNA synthetase
MAAKYHGSLVPAPGALEDEDKRLQSLAAEALRNFAVLFANMRPDAALAALWELVRGLNKYVDSQAPWALAKAGRAERLNTVMSCLLECMYKVACCLWPVMPDAASAMLRQLGLEADRDVPPLCDLLAEAERWGGIRAGQKLAAGSNLFPRMESPAPDGSEKTEQPAGNGPAEAVTPVAGTIAFADFQKVDLRVGTVLAAERHPDADKLLKLTVDLGEAAPRQIVSGLARHFAPEELPGRQVCVAANLAPRTIRGLESQGMILTAEAGDGLRLLTVAGEAPPGSRIT